MKFNNRKADMSINLIVVAAIALLVMIILIALFASKIGQFGKQGDSCANKGGICMASCEDPPSSAPEGNYISIPAKGCDTSKKYCCLLLGGVDKEK
jgi:hypothetical protein